jgi:hypothetical protein
MVDRKEYYRNYNAKRKERMAEYDITRREDKKLRERKYRLENPERYKKYSKKNYDKNKTNWSGVSREMTLLKNSRTRARKKDIPHEIVLGDIVIPEYCPVFKNIKLSLTNNKSCHDSPSLDRIRPELGYVKGNIVVISHLANTIKSQGTADQHRRIADWMDTFIS